MTGTRLFNYYIGRACDDCGVKPILSDDKHATVCPSCKEKRLELWRREYQRVLDAPQVFDYPGVDA